MRTYGSKYTVALAIVAVTLLGSAVLLNRIQARPADDAGSTIATTAPVDLGHPFANTPTATWSEGAAGIQPPAAAPIGRYSAATVTAATDRVKQLIVAARLDQHVLETQDAEPVLALLATHQVEDIRPKLKSGNAADTWWLTEKLAPGYRLLPVSPRVEGSMTVGLNSKGELAIRTDYSVAYAFTPPDRTGYGAFDIVAMVRRVVEYDWVEDPAYDGGSQGMWIGDVQGFAYPVNCFLGKKGYLAPNYGNPPSFGGAPDKHRPEYYFDRSMPMPQDGNC
ncbi:hypothetical protein [Nocardia sp. CA-145437]|uniref:hypothetical protein n=1 Tax=Nocardia sp. CA-145437 TaxID=3239980 RepID=UPI003D964CDB